MYHTCPARFLCNQMTLIVASQPIPVQRFPNSPGSAASQRFQFKVVLVTATAPSSLGPPGDSWAMVTRLRVAPRAFTKGRSTGSTCRPAEVTGKRTKIEAPYNLVIHWQDLSGSMKERLGGRERKASFLILILIMTAFLPDTLKGARTVSVVFPLIVHKLNVYIVCRLSARENRNVIVSVENLVSLSRGLRVVHIQSFYCIRLLKAK